VYLRGLGGVAGKSIDVLKSCAMADWEIDKTTRCETVFADRAGALSSWQIRHDLWNEFEGGFMIRAVIFGGAC